MLQEQKAYIEEKSYRRIWNNYIIFAQKYYNPTTLIVYKHMYV